MKHKALSLWLNRRARERALAAIENLFVILNRDLLTTDAMKSFDESATEILLAIVQGREPSPKAMSVFLAALNGKASHVDYRPGQRADRIREQAIMNENWIAKGSQIPEIESELLLWKEDKARVISGEWDFQMDLVRYGAEALRDYLQMIAVCGPLHKSCALPGCDRITVGGQGNKRFCSDEHRMEFWSYGRQKEYFKKNRQNSRNIKSRDSKKTVGKFVGK